RGRGRGGSCRSTARRHGRRRTQTSPYSRGRLRRREGSRDCAASLPGLLLQRLVDGGLVALGLAGGRLRPAALLGLARRGLRTIFWFDAGHVGPPARSLQQVKCPKNENGRTAPALLV